MAQSRGNPPPKRRLTGAEIYRRRIERRLGMPIEFAKSRGISLAAARGHKPHEHQTRAIRARAEGRLIEKELAFLKRQRKRWEMDYKEGKEFFRNLDQEMRDFIMTGQKYAEQEYRSKKRPRFHWDIDAIKAGWRPFPPPYSAEAQCMWYR